MSKFDDFLKALKDGIKELAEESWKEYQQSAVKDGSAFVEKTKEDLERWTKLLANGDLTPKDFEWLVKGKKDLAELEALKQAGLALARLDQLRNSLIDLVVGTAFKIFL